MTRKQKIMLRRILVAAAMCVILAFLPVDGWLKFALYLLPYLVVGYDVLWDAIRGICQGQVFDENFLMAVATVGALALGLTRTGDYLEAVAVMLFYQVGELFQGYAVGKSRRSIAQLMDIRPDYANVEQDGKLQTVDPEQVAVGTIIFVQPGEKVPLDGVVVEGSASLNTSALTGESLPRTVMPGDPITSGCVDLDGLLKVRTTKTFSQSTVAKILDLVENAAARKSRQEQFVTRFARVYTPAVCLSALALAVLPPVALLLWGADPQWGDWFYRALNFLVISCPCALVLSVPLTFFAGLGGASSMGVLVKGSNYLEALSRVDTVVLDKTGTLTQGTFRVTRVCHNTVPRETLLEYAALAEYSSTHPIARSICAAYEAELDRGRIEAVREISGGGVLAQVDGREVAVGNGKWMTLQGISCPAGETAGTAVHVAVDGQYWGQICLADVEKPQAREAIRALKELGISKTVMLTGDNAAAAVQTAENLGIDTYVSDLHPEDKVTQVEALLSQGARLAFVGDGINDAPVLSRADVGIAMGALGSDAAIEAADVVLMDDDPRKIAQAIAHARRTVSIVRQNIAFALGVKGLCLLLGALGVSNLWFAIFADVGVMVLAVLNGIRAMKVANVKKS